MPTYPPGSVRVVARATAIIQDPVQRFLLTFHEEQGHYFLPGGKAKDLHGNDLTQVFTHPGKAAEYVQRLFTMRRESAREAGVREVWEELRKAKLVSNMRWKDAKKRFEIIDSLDAIEIMSLHDGPDRYRPDIDTKNIILPCKMRLPRVWEAEIQLLWEARDPRIWYATAAEIIHGHTTQAKLISPDVARIFVRRGLIAPLPREQPRESPTAPADEDSEGHPATLNASA